MTDTECRTDHATEDKRRTAQAAIRQIQEKHYVRGLTDFGCERYRAIGIAFAGRSCAVVTEVLEVAD